MAQAPQQPTFNRQVDYVQSPSQQPGHGPPAPMLYHPPQQTTGPQNKYQTVVAIPNLGVAPAPVDCPSCTQRAMTNATYHSGNVTQ
jgi:lipopolysaccharide-induced tumor necrosis factor-alpha factor